MLSLVYIFSDSVFGHMVVEKMVLERLIFPLVYGIWLSVSRFLLRTSRFVPAVLTLEVSPVAGVGLCAACTV